jgi:cbb3-type cytochrome oxidase subunit 1
VIAGYIPAEPLAAYLVVLGLLSPSAEATGDEVTIVRFVSFLLGIAVAVGAAYVAFKGGTLTRREQRRREFVVAVLAAVSFAVYAAAMPSFFIKATILTIPFSQWAAIVAILVVVSMPTIAKALNVRR